MSPGSPSTRTDARSPVGPLERVPAIAEGDAAAARGDWPRAIGIWLSHPDSAQRDAATERIRWFLGETDPVQPGIPSFQSHRQASHIPLAVALGCGLVATALVLIAEGTDGTRAVVLASAAWLLYILSATLAVVHAHRTGRPSSRTQSRLSTDETVRARHLAEAIGATKGGESPPV